MFFHWASCAFSARACRWRFHRISNVTRARGRARQGSNNPCDNKFHERIDITMISKAYRATKIMGTQYSTAVRCVYSSALFPRHRYFHSVVNAEAGNLFSIAFITLNLALFKSLYRRIVVAQHKQNRIPAIDAMIAQSKM